MIRHLSLASLPALLLLAACAQMPQPADGNQLPVSSRLAPAAQTKAPAPPQLRDENHRYRFSWDGNLSGNATRTLSCENDRCEFTMRASVPGLATLTERSRFRWQADRVQFNDYERRLQLLFVPQVLTIQRPAGNGPVLSNRRGRAYQYDNHPELVDAIGLELQLRQDLLRLGRPATLYRLADSREVREVRFQEQAGETLTINDRALPARVFVTHNGDGSRETRVWLDPQRGFLPLQILHRDGRETYRLEWLGD